MSDHDRDESLIDKVKNAFGMGDDHEARDAHEAHDRQAQAVEDRHDPIDMERPAADESPERHEPIGGIDGATQASGYEGATGGMGASGAMGGAGASGPVGATEPFDDPTAGAADPGAVRTEYEMGHEFDPDHETRAESGVLSQGSEGTRSTVTRGEAASGESPFDGPQDDRARPGPAS